MLSPRLKDGVCSKEPLERCGFSGSGLPAHEEAAPLMPSVRWLAARLPLAQNGTHERIELAPELRIPFRLDMLVFQLFTRRQYDFLLV